jgi:predicted enzyme related to lactoylglutathione lyase
VETPPFLIELPADDPDRARRFLEELLGTTLEPRARASPSSKEVADMPESGLPIRVYKEHDTWHVD